VIDDVVPFVALPTPGALGRAVRVTNVLNNKSQIAIVLDVGPHNDHDEPYVFGGARPSAERGISCVNGVTTQARNCAGIDLGKPVWDGIGMLDNTEVD
jgi:hypothetical protein